VANSQHSTPSTIADDQAMDEVKRLETGPLWMNELGTTGLKRSAGYIDEEFLPHLRGRKAVQVYREMGDNDAISSAMLFTITQLLRGVDWPVVPGGKTKDDLKAAKLVETCMQDMSSSWDDVIQEILSCLQYGWAWHEIVYKRRMGPWETDGRHRSKYSDGLVGWRKMPIRAQETLQRWVFDDTGDVQALIQLAPPDYKTRTIPISRSLLFRFGHHKGNPEGKSILRGSYRSWYYKKRLEEFESVGVERDLAGLPMVSVPSEYLRAKPGSDQHKMVESMKKMVRSIRRNEQEGLVFPTAYDPDTKQPLFKFELLTSGGSRTFNTNELIQRYEQRQLMTVLADFIMVGHQGSTGTYNLHVDKTGIFREALNAVALSIAEVFNRHAIPRLFAANGWKPKTLPTIQPANVDSPDLSQLSQFLTSTAGLGFSWGPDPDMERFLRNAAGLPELGESEMDSNRQNARMDEAARFAETQTRLMAARSQLAQAMAAEQQIAAGEHTVESAQMMQQAGQSNVQQEQQMDSHAQSQAQGEQGLARGQQQMALAEAGEGRAVTTESRTADSHKFDQKQALRQNSSDDKAKKLKRPAAKGKK
jgi:hypothetical protein